MMLQNIVTLYESNRWANGRTLDAAEKLDPAAFVKDLKNSFPSVRDTLAHILGAEWIWLRRWRGESPAAAPGWVAGASLSELRDRLASIEADRDAYLTGLPDGDLARIVEYRTLSGQAGADRLEDLVRHVVNHATYHRGQVATQLRQLGVAPPGTDLVIYLRSRKPQ